MSKFRPLILALDLEFNQPSQKIVQIGAVVGDLRTGAIEGSLCVEVNPGEELAPYIADLCGLTPLQVSSAGPLSEGYEQLLAWMAPYNPERHLNPLTWGGGDSAALQQELGSPESWPFGRRWIDVKTVYASWMMSTGKAGVGGLKASLKKVGMPFAGRPHNARDDALNTFLIYHRLLRLMNPLAASTSQLSD